MTVRSLRPFLGKLGFAVLFIATSVTAQTGDDAGAGATDEVQFRKGSQLTAQEQLGQADSYIDKMRGVEKNVNQLARKARKDKDIIKLNCVNDKLTQIKGHQNLGDTTRKALKTAAARSDDAGRNHEFSKLTITYQKVIVLGQEAEACIGEDIAFVGATRVDVEVDPDIMSEDPTEEPPAPPVVIRPPVASPFI